MRKLILVASAAALPLVFVSGAQADENRAYLKLGAGAFDATVEDSFALDGQSAYGGAIGFKLWNVRIEAGAERLEAEAFGGAISAQADVLSLTGFFDVPIGKATAFVGAGLDWMGADTNMGLGADLDFEPDGYHIDLGLSYRITENVTAEVAYRSYSATLDTNWAGELDVDAGRTMFAVRLDL